MSEIKVLEGYRVTIPEEVRRRLRIRKGDKLLCELRGREIILKAEHLPEAPTLRMLGLAADVKATPEQAVLEEVQEKLGRHSKVSRR
jgi:AbrB family looped-hinge helix DNA binding protein